MGPLFGILFFLVSLGVLGAIMSVPWLDFVAVLLLIAGTILGALWADFAWGRFWGWDAKEVWSLITILAYLIILHGRYAGWAGNFGLAAGSVLGLTSIAMAWYGVNFVLSSGLHSYGGGGSGGQWTVIFGAVLNWLFLGAAAVRYNVETLLADTTPVYPTVPGDPGVEEDEVLPVLPADAAAQE